MWALIVATFWIPYCLITAMVASSFSRETKTMVGRFASSIALLIRSKVVMRQWSLTTEITSPSSRFRV